MPPPNPIYCLDTNFFIYLKRYYFPEVFVTLKKNLENLAKEERIIMSKFVLDELERQADEISKWVKTNFPRVEDIDNDQEKILHAIIQQNKKWAEGEKTPADPFIIALAEVKGFVVVTHEKRFSFNEGANNRIPAVCEYRKVTCLHTKEFFKQEGWLF